MSHHVQVGPLLLLESDGRAASSNAKAEDLTQGVRVRCTYIQVGREGRGDSGKERYQSLGDPSEKHACISSPSVHAFYPQAEGSLAAFR